MLCLGVFVSHREYISTAAYCAMSVSCLFIFVSGVSLIKNVIMYLLDRSVSKSTHTQDSRLNGLSTNGERGDLGPGLPSAHCNITAD